MLRISRRARFTGVGQHTVLIAAVTILTACSQPRWVIAGTAIDVGTHFLKPDTADQVIVVQARSQGPVDGVTGFNLRAQIGDGLGDQPEPIFSAIDFQGDTIWGLQNITVLGGPVFEAPQFAQASVVVNTSGILVPAEGIVARLHIDTSGLTQGTFPLALEGTQIGFPSAFIRSGGSELVPAIQNGVLRIWEDVCGDFDRDGDVDASDQTALVLGWTGALESGVGSASFDQGDCDADGDVDSADFTGLILNWTGALAGTLAAESTGATLRYSPATGEVWLDPAGSPSGAILAVVLGSATHQLRPEAFAPPFASSLTDQTSFQIGQIDPTHRGVLQTMALGTILPPGLESLDQLREVLSMATYAAGLGSGGDLNLVIVPEPNSSILCLTLLLAAFLRHRKALAG